MSKPASPWNERDYEEACEWFVEFRTGVPNAVRRQAFHAWLQQSPAHMGAYLEATAVWNQTAALTPQSKYSVDALIAAAAADRDTVRFFGSISNAAAQGSVQKVHRKVLGALAAAVALVTFGIVGLQFLRDSQTYSTAIGEQRSVVLKDGSIIELNSRSTVRVRYSEHARNIQLLTGQALFTVAHDTSRPFLVSADGTAVRAVGTQFDVNRLPTETVVTVLEGRVAVEQASRRSTSGLNSDTPLDSSPERSNSERSPPSESTSMVAAGEQIRVRPSGGVERASRPDIAAATAWTQRRLVFESTSLADVVEEFNRYNSRPLRIESAQLGTFQIDGVFSSTDPEPMIRFLRSRPGIQVTETDRAIEISVTPSQP